MTLCTHLTFIIKLKEIFIFLFSYISRPFIKYYPARYILRKVRHNIFPVSVAIQTTSYCNGYCIICPYRVVYNKLPQGVMTWDLYKKIIDECSYYKVRLLQFFMFGEPLLDKDIVKRLNYAKEKINKAKIIISTNASLLTKELTHQLIKYVDIFIFNVLGITK